MKGSRKGRTNMGKFPQTDFSFSKALVLYGSVFFYATI